jgi:hypothetical protein
MIQNIQIILNFSKKKKKFKFSAEHTRATRQSRFSITGNSFCSFSDDKQRKEVTSRGVHGSKEKK